MIHNNPFTKSLLNWIKMDIDLRGYILIDPMMSGSGGLTHYLFQKNPNRISNVRLRSWICLMLVWPTDAIGHWFDSQYLSCLFRSGY